MLYSVKDTCCIIWNYSILAKNTFSHFWDRNIRQFWRQEKWCPTLEGETSPFRKLFTYDVTECQRQNNLEKSRLVCVLDIFCQFLDKNEKSNQSPHWGRDSGIPSSCPSFATSTTQQASSLIANLGHSDGIPSSLPQCGVRFYLYSLTISCTLFNPAKILRNAPCIVPYIQHW